LASFCAIAAYGKGRWRDNVFVERIWKSIKYEEVYLHAYASVGEASTSIGVTWSSTTLPGRTPA
jgi:putative transposase